MNWLPVLILLFPIISSLIILLLWEDFPKIHSFVDLAGNSIRLLLLGFAIGSFPTHGFHFNLGNTPLFQLDELALLFLLFFSALWFIITLYAFGYLQNHIQYSRFLILAGLGNAAVTGIIISANLLILLIFYELLALIVYALITFDNTTETQRVGRIYLRYMTLGSIVLLLAIISLVGLGKLSSFTEKISVENYKTYQSLNIIFFLLFTGFSIKTALIPFQRWFLQITVASVLVIALLSTLLGIQVGLFGILRLIFYLYSTEFVYLAGLFNLLALIAMITFLYSATRAVLEDNLLKRMTWIAISQGAFALLSLSLLIDLEMTLMILFWQSSLLILLFLCVGNWVKVLNIQKINDIQGIAQEMPATLIMFSLGTLGLIGLPLLLITLLAQSLLTLPILIILIGLVTITLFKLAFFTPIVYKGWGRRKMIEERYFQLKMPTALLLAPWLVIALFLLVILFYLFVKIGVVPTTIFSFPTILH